MIKSNSKNKKKFESSTKRRNVIIGLAIFISIILYLAGVYSGLYANKILERQTEDKIVNFKNETKTDLQNLKQETTETKIGFEILSDYVKYLDLHLKDMQLEQAFSENLDKYQKCNFTDIVLSELLSEFDYYWERLPFRIEEYESSNPKLSAEYLLIKNQYTKLSIRTWIFSVNKVNECKGNLVPILYLYSSNCKDCIKQGEELDKLKSIEKEINKQILIFTVDINTDGSILKYLKNYYNINKTPSLLIQDNIYQGRVFSAQELSQVII